MVVMARRKEDANCMLLRCPDLVFMLGKRVSGGGVLVLCIFIFILYVCNIKYCIIKE